MGFHVRCVLYILTVSLYPDDFMHGSVNGCSVKTEQNLATTKAIPFSHLMLETGT